MICPYCGHDNLAGADLCVECNQSLVDLDDGGSILVQSISSHSINVLNPRAPVAVSPGDTLANAVATMTGKRIGCVLVVEAGALVGILTERDVLNKSAEDFSNLDRPVSEFMTADPATIRTQDSIAYALHAMDLGGYRHLPIVDEDDAPSGIISVRDILRFLCVRFANSRSAT